MKKLTKIALCTASAIGLVSPALVYAQTVEDGDSDFALDEPIDEEADTFDAIIVTARRRLESVQEVPIVIDTVSSEDIEKLNLREFEEIEGLVPGLSLETQGFAGGGAIRGIAFDSRVSGNNAAVEFYLNDTPVNGGALLQQLYDVQQIEVLRGPQGTLRGRASPSGSITVTTRKPDLYEAGGSMAMTGTHTGTLNFNGAVGIPIVEGVAAVRVAGVYDTGNGNRVRTIVDDPIDGRDPYNEAQGYRASVLVEPTEWLRLEGMYQYLDTYSRNFELVESGNLANPNAPVSPIQIDPSDRLSIEASPTEQYQKYHLYTWGAELSVLRQSLIYVGNYRKQSIQVFNNDDNANFFPDFDFGQFTDSRSMDEAHELRLQNQDLIFGMFDYVIGAFRQNNNPPTDLIQYTPVALPPFLGGSVVTIAQTPIERFGKSEETSFFGNITAHIGDNFEISGGLRYLEIDQESILTVGGNELVNNPTEDDALIYTASANYFVNPDVMIYASTGTSFRAGPTAIGDFSARKSDLQRSFTELPAEKSTSYEIGLKSTLMNGRMRFNISGYYQDFENYPYRSAGQGVFYQSFGVARDATGAVTGLVPEVASFNYVAAVPVEVKGVEAEIGFEVTPSWDLNLVASYVDGQIQDGVIPCNDLDGDGNPDNLVGQPTLQEVQDAYGTDYVGACTVSQRSGFQSPFTATLQSEYGVPVGNDVDAFARGLFSFYGKSRGNPSNAFDDVGAYGLLNLYAGLRAPDGRWELSFYGKNIFDTIEVLSREDTLAATNYRVLQPPTFRSAAGASASAPYRSISITQPREFGLNFRFAFGSR